MLPMAMAASRCRGGGGRTVGGGWRGDRRSEAERCCAFLFPRWQAAKSSPVCKYLGGLVSGSSITSEKWMESWGGTESTSKG